MADKITVAVSLTKEVADDAEAKALIGIVKNKLADKPDIKVSANIYNKVDVEVL